MFSRAKRNSSSRAYDTGSDTTPKHDQAPTIPYKHNKNIKFNQNKKDKTDDGTKQE